MIDGSFLKQYTGVYHYDYVIVSAKDMAYMACI